jgi:acetyltransferase-like isoleucine patch superfamily enzyme
VNIKTIVKRRIGPRTFYKSLYAYSKGKAYQDGHRLNDFLINGSAIVALHENISIINKGTFYLGLVPISAFLNTKKPCVLQMGENSKLIINGTVNAGPGTFISISNNASIEFGDNVYINSDSKLISYSSIKIGADSEIAWEVEICDMDFHRMVRDDFEISKPIEIGSRVWIGSRVSILKGVKIGSGAVIATGAVVTRDVPENSLAAGVPARIIKENIIWKK